jgi:hypothetical protein
MKHALLISLTAAAAVLGGCVVAPAPYGRPYYREPVIVAPPPPRVEYPGPPPVTGYIWIGGNWNWVGNRHEWAPGHWEAPRPGYNWVPRNWERDGDRWRQSGGRWEEDRGRDRDDRD